MISLIISCGSVEAQVRSTIEDVAARQPVSSVELILVGWEGFDYTRFGHGFHSVRQVHFPRHAGLNQGLAEAARIAAGRYILFLEDHVRVTGNWVEELPGIFEREGCAAVGWTTLPGDLDNRVSWAGYLAEYGLWGPGVPEGPSRDHLPGHNSAYERQVLLDCGSELDSLMRAESLLHWRLLSEGRKLYFTTRFVLRHAQFKSIRKLCVANFWYGWNFGDARRQARRWGFLQRTVYAGAILLKPFIRWRKLAATPRDQSAFPGGLLASTWPIVSMAFVWGAVGEAFGYLCGPWQAPARLTVYELGFDRSEP